MLLAIMNGIWIRVRTRVSYLLLSTGKCWPFCHQKWYKKIVNALWIWLGCLLQLLS